MDAGWVVPRDAGTSRDAGAADAGPEPPDAAVKPDGGTPTGAWPVRSCERTIVHLAPGAAERVQLAGDFTDWGEDPRDLSDDDGDGRWEITLRPEDGLEPGRRYAYKLIVDGTWVLDRTASLRELGGGCLNSAFEMPACTNRPLIEAEPIETRLVDGRGGAETTLRFAAATDGADLETIDISVDGSQVPEGSLSVDEAAGTVDVSLGELDPGRHVLSVRVTDAAGRQALPLDLPFWIEAEPFAWRDATMYMFVVDRFANGNRDIDDPVGGEVAYPADFHGGDLWGALEVLESGYFEDLGVNAIWLSPINRQAEGAFEGRDDTRQYAGYHGYWPSHGREVEPRFGGNEALAAFVEAAHERGIRVLFDLINNQVHTQHEYYLENPDWFRTGCVCGIDPGCGWSERPFDCLFAPYLPDIDWRVPEAERQFVDDAVFWVRELGIDGFRIDAVKHVEPHSIYNLRAALQRRFEQGGERLFLVGETAVGQWDSVDLGCGESYSDGYAWIDAYVGEHALDGQFDFPTHHRLQDGLVTGEMGFDAVEAVVRDLETRYAPEGLHVRFLGTHDSNRMASRAAYDPSRDCRWAGEGCDTLPSTPGDPATFGRLRRAFTVLHTLPGIPFVYYGDEIAMPGGNDPDNRRDMVWTGDLADVGMGEIALTPAREALRSHVAALGKARAASKALRRGRRVPLLVTSDLYVYAWAHDDPGELAVVAVNRGGAVNGRTVEGLTPSLVGDVASFAAVAGTGTASLDGSRLVLTLGAGESVVLLGRTP